MKDALKGILVLEVPTWEYSRRKAAPVEIRKDRRRWQSYYGSCLAEAGFTDVQAIAAGSYFVSALEAVRNRRLIEDLVFKRLEGTGVPGFPDEDGEEHLLEERVLGLDGGVALFRGERLLVEPQCCCSFDDISEWRGCFEDPLPTMIWIGHPWLTPSRSGDQITLVQANESIHEAENEPFTLLIDELDSTLRDIARQHQIFSTKLQSILEADPRTAAISSDLCRILAGAVSSGL